MFKQFFETIFYIISAKRRTFTLYKVWGLVETDIRRTSMMTKQCDLNERD